MGDPKTVGMVRKNVTSMHVVPLEARVLRTNPPHDVFALFSVGGGDSAPGGHPAISCHRWLWALGDLRDFPAAEEKSVGSLAVLGMFFREPPWQPTVWMDRFVCPSYPKPRGPMVLPSPERGPPVLGAPIRWDE